MSYQSGTGRSPEYGGGWLERLPSWLGPAAGMLGGAVVVAAAPAAAQISVGGTAAAAEFLLVAMAVQAQRLQQSAHQERAMRQQAQAELMRAIASAAGDIEKARQTIAAVERLLQITINFAYAEVERGTPLDQVLEYVRRDADTGPLDSQLQVDLVRSVLQAHLTIQDLSRQLAEADDLVHKTLPALVDQVRNGADVEDVLASFAQDGREPAWQQDLVQRVLEAEDRGQGRSESARRLATAMGQRLQSTMHIILRTLQDLQEEHHAHPVVFGMLQDLDRQASQAARLADSLVVLGGGRPLQRWIQPVSLYDVLRGALSQIGDGFLRVDLREEAVARMGVEGAAVRSLVHLLAELLKNAVQYSPPTTRVRLWAEPVHRGVVVVVDDEGVGMPPEKLARCQQMLSGRLEATLEDLGESLQTGLPVIALLAKAHGIDVVLGTSSRGGTQASVLIPRHLLTDMPQHRPQEPAVEPAATTRVKSPLTVADSLVEGSTEAGLPRRRREDTAPVSAGQAPRAVAPVVTDEHRRAALTALTRPTARNDAMHPQEEEK